MSKHSKPWTGGGQAKTKGIGARNVTTGGTTVRLPKTRKDLPNGAGPRKQS